MRASVCYEARHHEATQGGLGEHCMWFFSLDWRRAMASLDVACCEEVLRRHLREEAWSRRDMYGPRCPAVSQSLRAAGILRDDLRQDRTYMTRAPNLYTAAREINTLLLLLVCTSFSLDYRNHGHAPVAASLRGGGTRCKQIPTLPKTTYSHPTRQTRLRSTTCGG